MTSTDKEFVEKTINWFNNTYASIYAAGGSPDYEIKKFPYDLLETMIRNNLHITYRKPIDEN